MSLEGHWYNELGTELILMVDGMNVRGTCRPTVGDAPASYAVVGLTDEAPSLDVRVIAFSVVWDSQEHGDLHAITAWSGRYRRVDGDEVLETLWVRTVETEPDADSQPTHVGRDTFRRARPSNDEVVSRLQMMSASHPLYVSTWDSPPHRDVPQAGHAAKRSAD